MKLPTHIPFITSVLGVACIIEAVPVRGPGIRGQTIGRIPLINHNNGEFWSTGVQVEGIPRGSIDTALDTGGGQFIVPSATTPPCEEGNCQRGTCK